MKKFVTYVTLLIILTLTLTSCKSTKQFEKIYYEMFDTVITFTVFTENKDEFELIEKIFFEKMDYYHKIFDIYNEYNNINNLYTINNSKAPVKVDDELIEFLLLNKENYNKTNGQVNIAFGSVLKVWSYYRDLNNNTLPTKKELEEANLHSNINDLIIDKDKATVYLADKLMSIDVGATAKGYAVYKVAEHLKDFGYDNILINAGGNVCALGGKILNNKEVPFKVALTNPLNLNDNIKTFDLIDKSLVSSGDYLRYFTVDDINYHHIIDTKTLYPANFYKQVTVLYENSFIADLLSTALFTMPFEKCQDLIKQYNNIEVMFIFEDEIKIIKN